jgi:hypothetical protein
MPRVRTSPAVTNLIGLMRFATSRQEPGHGRAAVHDIPVEADQLQPRNALQSTTYHLLGKFVARRVSP